LDPPRRQEIKGGISLQFRRPRAGKRQPGFDDPVDAPG
jgi:hypothetical protein